VELSDDDEKRLTLHRQQLIDGEKALFAHYIEIIRKAHEEQWRKVQKMMRSGSGFCMNRWVSRCAITSYALLCTYFIGTLIWYIFVQ